jgi:uncharacterized membrane-anchored protein YhcB (DUF1043 family)
MRIRFLVFTLSFWLVIPSVLAAQTQAVSPAELQEAIKNSAQTQQKNRKDVEAFFSSEPARKALKAGKIDYQRVQTAVATLSPDELSHLAARANQLQQDFAGGALNNQQMTYAIIAIATAVLVLLIVAAH